MSAADAKLMRAEAYEVSWSSAYIATTVCGNLGHLLVQFGSMGTILCERCGLNLTQINTGRLISGESNASST